MRRTRRHVLSTAAATTLFTVAGLTVGIRQASGDIGADFSYKCTTPEGIKKIGLQVTGSVSASGSVGRPVEFGRITLTAKIAFADLPAFVKSQPAADNGEAVATPSLGVTGTAKLLVSAAQGDLSTDAQWPPFPMQSADSAQADTLKIAGTQVVRPLIPSVPGKIRLLSNSLELKLISGTGQSSTDPVSCAPSETAELASIDISERNTTSTGSQQQEQAPSTPANAPLVQEETSCKELDLPPGYFNDDPALSVDNVEEKFPPGVVLRNGTQRNVFCVNLTGFANSNKLSGAIPVSAESNVRRALLTGALPTPFFYTQQRGVAEAIPRESRATLLGFGFMPTTVAVQAQQVAGQNGDHLANFRNDLYGEASNIPGFGVNDAAERVWIRAHVSALARNASINGVPLDLGSNCRSARNVVELKSLLGNPRLGQTGITAGSSYAGRIKILPFENCGVGEDLSPLLTATSSGENNFTNLRASPWCNLVDLVGCTGNPPRAGAPTTISVKHGSGLHETLTGSTPFTVRIGAGQAARQITCATVRAQFQFKQGRWLAKEHVGQLTAFEPSGCVVNPEGIPVRLERTSDFSNFVTLDAPTMEGNTPFAASGLQFRIIEPQSQCNLVVGDKSTVSPPVPIGLRFLLSYNNVSHILTGTSKNSGFNGGVLENNCGPPLNFNPTARISVNVTWPTAELVSEEPRLTITSP